MSPLNLHNSGNLNKKHIMGRRPFICYDCHFSIFFGPISRKPIQLHKKAEMNAFDDDLEIWNHFRAYQLPVWCVMLIWIRSVESPFINTAIKSFGCHANSNAVDDFKFQIIFQIVQNCHEFPASRIRPLDFFPLLWPTIFRWNVIVWFVICVWLIGLTPWTMNKMTAWSMFNLNEFLSLFAFGRSFVHFWFAWHTKPRKTIRFVAMSEIGWRFLLTFWITNYNIFKNELCRISNNTHWDTRTHTRNGNIFPMYFISMTDFVHKSVVVCFLIPNRVFGFGSFYISGLRTRVLMHVYRWNRKSKYWMRTSTTIVGKHCRIKDSEYSMMAYTEPPFPPPPASETFKWICMKLSLWQCHIAIFHLTALQSLWHFWNL